MTGSEYVRIGERWRTAEGERDEYSRIGERDEYSRIGERDEYLEIGERYGGASRTGAPRGIGHIHREERTPPPRWGASGPRTRRRSAHFCCVLDNGAVGMVAPIAPLHGSPRHGGWVACIVLADRTAAATTHATEQGAEEALAAHFAGLPVQWYGGMNLGYACLDREFGQWSMDEVGWMLESAARVRAAAGVWSAIAGPGVL